MKRTPLNRFGPKARSWFEARKKLKVEFEEKSITRCEVCGGDWALSFHHRNKRRFNDEHIYQNVILVCAVCHEYFEYHREDNTKLFSRLRPDVCS